MCDHKDSCPHCGLSADPEKHAQHPLPNTRASQQKHGEENDAEPEDEDGASGFYRSDDLNSENEKKETNAERRILAKVKNADVVAVLEGKDPESVSFKDVFRLLENRLQLPDSFFDAEDQKMKVRKRVVKIIEHRVKKRKHDDKDREAKLEEARRLKKVFIDKAAGLATQLMEGGAVDSEKPEASSHKPWVSLKNEPRGRRRPCPPYTCKADSRAWSRIILM